MYYLWLHIINVVVFIILLICFGAQLIATLICTILCLVFAKGFPQGCVVCLILAICFGKGLFIILLIWAALNYMFWSTGDLICGTPNTTRKGKHENKSKQNKQRSTSRA